MTREEFVSQTIDRGMFGLEVGPSYEPTLPRSDGWNVETIDHAPADELRKKYASLTDISKIEDVDYISDARPIHEVIARRNEYDFIFASHVIEHVTDIVGFIQSCELLLKPTGKLVLIVPDKRQCFDAVQARTSTGDVLEAHRRRAVRHNPGSTFDFFANRVELGGSGIWETHWVKQLKLSFETPVSIQDAKHLYDQAAKEQDYIDIHAWTFVPSSFRMIMQDLERLSLTGLKEAFLRETNRFEFYFVASPTGEGCTLSRLELSKAIAWEEIEGLMQIVQAQ